MPLHGCTKSRKSSHYKTTGNDHTAASPPRTSTTDLALVSAHRADKRTSGRKRFRLYAVYAWGCPLLMASLALIMDLAPGIDNCSVIKPAFGRYRCLFQSEYTTPHARSLLLQIEVWKACGPMMDTIGM